MHHIKMTTLNETAMRSEVSDSRLLMTSYGLNVSSFAYPFSGANDSVVRAVSKEYMAARLTGDLDDYIGYYPELSRKRSSL
jgi:hypothetical protein